MEIKKLKKVTKCKSILTFAKEQTRSIHRSSKR